MAKQQKKSTARRVPRAAEPRMYGDGKPSQPAEAQQAAAAAPAKTATHRCGTAATSRTAGATPRGVGAAGSYTRVDRIADYSLCQARPAPAGDYGCGHPRRARGPWVHRPLDFAQVDRAYNARSLRLPACFEQGPGSFVSPGLCGLIGFDWGRKEQREPPHRQRLDGDVDGEAQPEIAGEDEQARGRNRERRAAQATSRSPVRRKRARANGSRAHSIPATASPSHAPQYSGSACNPCSKRSASGAEGRPMARASQPIDGRAIECPVPLFERGVERRPQHGKHPRQAGRPRPCRVRQIVAGAVTYRRLFQPGLAVDQPAEEQAAHDQPGQDHPV